jgi:hypothetical protein
MEKNVTKSNNGIKHYLIVFCLIVAMMAMTVVPAFAAENENVLILEKGNSFDSSNKKPEVLLYIDADRPLTLRFLMDNPEYYFKMQDHDSGYNYDLLVYIGETGSFKNLSNATIRENAIVNYDYFVSKNIYETLTNEELDSPLAIKEQTGSLVTWTVSDAAEPPAPPPPPDGWDNIRSLLNTVESVVDMIFATAAVVMAFIWSEPIVLIPVVFGFAMIAI